MTIRHDQVVWPPDIRDLEQGDLEPVAEGLEARVFRLRESGEPVIRQLLRDRRSSAWQFRTSGRADRPILWAPADNRWEALCAWAAAAERRRARS